MVMLIDNGSSNTFINASFVAKAGLQTIPTPPKLVKLANGEVLMTDQCVQGLEWWMQGHTFCTDMQVLELGAYDCILGYDWLQQNSPHMIRVTGLFSFGIKESK